MKNSVLRFLLIIGAAGLSGCDSLSYSQYVIRGATPKDEKAVAGVLAAAANVGGMRDSTTESRVPNTVAYYKTSVGHFPVILGARVIDPDVVIDLSCFHPGPQSSAPEMFKTIDKVLSRELTKAFGERLVANPEPRIPFSEERAPNQLPDPTSSSVTRPAGAGHAPSVAADH